MEKYVPSKNYHPKEGSDGFAARLKREAKEQLVRVSYGGKRYAVRFSASGFTAAKSGRFQVIPSRVMFGRWGWQYVLAYPDVRTLLKKKRIMLRLDSGCYTGMVFGDFCDCAEQLQLAERLCVERGGGIIVHIPGHEGKGHRLSRFPKERLVQELGMSEAEAAQAFGHRFDVRTFEESAIILKALGFAGHAFELATQNPQKTAAIKKPA